MNFTCYMGRFSDEPPPPPDLCQRVEEYFTYYSRQAGGEAAISLTVDPHSRFANPLAPPGAWADAPMLRNALAQLTRNDPRQRVAQEIGVIFAGSYQPAPDLFGLMFDEDVLRDPTGQVVSVPREGCSVFLDAIGQWRPQGDQFKQEVFFTVMHELGHVFNLNHWNEPLNFMSSSRVAGPYPPSQAYRFLQQHSDFLSLCGHTPYVTPGGSSFGDRGPYSLPGDDDPSNAPTASQLSLKLSVAHPDILPALPVEVDISLSVEGPESVTVPHRLDPGYDNFIIFIQHPDGSKVRYRSPHRYCAHPSTLTITPGEPFERDLAVFAQSGSYTFGPPGRYGLEAFFKLQSGEVVRSNVVEVEVRPPKRKEATLLVPLLTDLELGRFMYYKKGKLTPNLLEKLEIACAERTLRQQTARLHHYLGLHYQQNESSGYSTSRNPASRHFEKAYKAADLGKCQRKRTERALKGRLT